MFNLPVIHMSLRWKLALLFGAPILSLLVLVAFVNYNRVRIALENQAESTAVHLGEMVLGGLDHGMMVNDSVMIQDILTHLGERGSIAKVWILDMQGVVRQSSHEQDLGLAMNTNNLGCVECHRLPEAQRANVYNLSDSGGPLRVVTLIDNQDKCQDCHAPENAHLGVLVVDTSLVDMKAQILQEQRWNLLFIFLVLLAGVGGTFEMVQLLVVRRIHVIQRSMTAFRKGDYTNRIQKNWHTSDELTNLADDFNRMAEALDLKRREQEEVSLARQLAVVEERERIARELHDGVAQFLGYINTKIMASRLKMKDGKLEGVEEYLEQMEKAVQEQSLDVRASIIGLKIHGQAGTGLVPGLRNYTDQIGRLTDFSTCLEYEPEVEALRLQPEIELQVMRIVQEAISNVRKHSGAHEARIRLRVEGDTLVLAVQDDGAGFNPWIRTPDSSNHFGLQIMRERADKIGAEFIIQSKPGAGTTILLRLQVEKN